MPTRRTNPVNIRPFAFNFLQLTETAAELPAGTYIHVEQLCEALNEWGAFVLADHFAQLARAQHDTSSVQF